MLWEFQMYLRLLAVQLRSQMQYRASFWADMVTTGLGSGIFFISIALVVQRFGGVGGWTLGEISFMIGMIEMAFGTMDMLFSGFDPDYFGVVVRQGSFDQVMLRPVGLGWQVLGSRFLLRRMGRIVQGLLIFLFSLSLIQVQWDLAKLLYLPVVIASQVLAMGSLFMMGSTVTFWTLQSIEAVNILTYGGTEMMSYPIHIYPTWLRRFFTYIVPFVFLNFYPALYLLDKPDPLGFPPFAPFLAPFVAIAFFLVALWFWRVGIDHYQGAGS